MNPEELTAGQQLIQLLWGHWLSWMLLVPVVGAGLTVLLPKERKGLLKGVGLTASLAVLGLAVGMWLGFDPAAEHFQFVELMRWIPAIGATYHLGIDGMSMLLAALTALLTPLALLGTWTAVEEKVKGFVVCLLLLETGMLGVFFARDLFLFYLFWEAMLIPMYLLIGVWGGPRRVYAAMKFILYTLVGSFLMLVAILVLYFMHARLAGGYTFDIAALEQFTVPAGAQTWLFLAFALAFAIKVPLWPLHTWLPDAHVEAPTAGSVILAGVLLKMGIYGLLRFALPFFPVAATLAVPWIGALAIIGILYGGLVAWVQKDIKSLVAYSSVAHLGFVVLGIFSLNGTGLSGSMIQMINHGLSTGALFLLVGFIYERRHTRDIHEFGGLAKVMPLFAALLLVTAFASAGLPGLNGFVGEFLILIGAFKASPWLAVPAVPGVIVAALYLLRLLRGVLFGPIRNEANRGLRDLGWRETMAVVPLVLFMVWIGVYPKPFLEPLEPVARRIEARMESVRPAPRPIPPGEQIVDPSEDPDHEQAHEAGGVQ
ncbi:MAG: NADH-quinone oxidoreductase subunit M [bacterium]